MSAITLDIAQKKLQTWLAADDAVAMGQQYRIDSGETYRWVTKADAKIIRDNIIFWSNMVNRLQRGSTAPVFRYGVPGEE